MPVSFYKLFEQINELANPEEEGPPLFDSGEDSQAMEVIRIGKNLGEEFWNNFMKVCNNAESLAELLGVNSQQVSEWPAKIKESLEKVEKSDSQDKRDKLVSTGDSEFAAGQGSESDIRPTP